MLSTLSPGGGVHWGSLIDRKYLGPDDISNPFVEKSDYENHRKRMSEIDQQRENIQQIYKNQKTLAQFETERKNLREKYFSGKMEEMIKKDEIK